ncbi:MAG: helix-turn-helix transcriptional regulator [Fibrobacterota bacterium]|nr:helix-turn-helix transcriptional regulator [Fibrobacterota bacterium]
MRNKAIPTIDPEAVAAVREYIVSLRKKKGMTQTEMGKKMGVSQRVVSYYENEATDISLEALTAIAQALEVPRRKLLLDTNESGTEEIPLPRPLQKRFEKVRKLSPKAQKSLQDYIDMLLKMEQLAA